MPVAVDFDRLIGEPRRVPGIGWAVPCDVVGLDSKKAKKSVKVLLFIRSRPAVIRIQSGIRPLRGLPAGIPRSIVTFCTL